MGSHHRHRRHRSPSPVSSITSSDSDDYVPRRSHRSKTYTPNPPKTTYYPRGGDADQYYHSDDSIQRGRTSKNKTHNRPPAYVTDPEEEDYEYEIPRSRIGSLERLPPEKKKHIVDDVLAAFGLVRNKPKDYDPDTIYVNADGTRVDVDGTDRTSRERSHRHRSRDYRDDSSDETREENKERRHERNLHLKEAAFAGKMAYKLHKHHKNEQEKERERHRRRSHDHHDRHRDDDYYGDSHRRDRRHSHSERSHRREEDRDDESRSSKSRSSRRSSRSGSRRRRGAQDNEHNPDANQALRAAIVAGALEAFRSRKTESGMTPNRIARIAASAIAAGGIDAVMRQHEGSEHHEQMKQIIEAALGGVGSSQFFGHRIRRRHGIGQRELIKSNLMRIATRKGLDRGALGSRTKNPRPKKDRTRSSNRFSSAWRALNDEWGGV